MHRKHQKTENKKNQKTEKENTVRVIDLGGRPEGRESIMEGIM